MPGLGLDWVFSCLCLAALGMSFVLSHFGQNIFNLILVVVAGIMAILTGQNVLTVLWNGLRELVPLFPLIVFIPMIGWILQQEKYIETVYYYMSKALKNSTSYFLSFAFLVQMTGYFMLAGAVVLIHQFVETLFKGKTGEGWEYLKNSPIMKGYALTAMWSVSLPSFAYAVAIVDAPLLRTQLLGIGLSIIGLVLAAVDYWAYEKRRGYSLTHEINQQISQFGQQNLASKLVFELIALFLILFTAILIVHEWFKLDLLVSVPIIVVVVTLIYFLYKGKLKTFGQKVAGMFRGEIARNSQEISLIICAGILIYTMRSSNIGTSLFNWIYEGTLNTPWLDILFVLPLFILLLGLMGISPMTIMVLMSGLLLNISLPYPPELIVLSLGIGNVLCLMLSPFTVTVVMMSGANGKPPFHNSIKLNARFAIKFFVAALAYLWIITAI
jgi:hypothetical protein